MAPSDSSSSTSAAPRGGKRCRQCRRPYSGFGDVCATCRKGGAQGAVQLCVECSSYYSGFGDLCDDCLDCRDQSFPSHEFRGLSSLSGISVDAFLKAREATELSGSAEPELSSGGSGEVKLPLSSSGELELLVSSSGGLELSLGTSAELELPISSRRTSKGKTHPDQRASPFTIEVPEFNSPCKSQRASVSSTAVPSEIGTTMSSASAFDAWEGTSAFFAHDLQYNMPATGSWHLGAERHTGLTGPSSTSALSKYCHPGQVFHNSWAPNFGEFHLSSATNHATSLGVGRLEGSFSQRKSASERQTDMLQAYAMLF